MRFARENLSSGIEEIFSSRGPKPFIGKTAAFYAEHKPRLSECTPVSLGTKPFWSFPA
jgi:hypothetical protein